MFLETNNINFEILSVLNLAWEKNNGDSGIRPYHSLSYRVVGDAQFTYADDVAFAKSNDLTFIPAYCEYTQQAKNEVLFVIHFLSDVNLPKKIKSYHTENSQYFERNFQELYRIWTSKKTGYEYKCKSILYKILSKIEQELDIGQFTDTADNKLSEAIEYIHDNFTSTNLTVEYLAHMCGMSDTYFRQLFVSVFHMTPLKYINILKTNYAKELLRSGYYTVSQVSDKCGFNNVQYFSLFIKKETGLSPSRFLPL